ncbi:MAG TPA: CsbD family protein [Polyangiaceae bacterium]|jgi:uncharacterized protein YjbJ (UPF0337 family)|nr:CsbD family protein [Polyangiaceae bacterium]
MNWDTIEGQWKQFKGRAKQAWSKLTDDDLANLNGKREQLAGKIQERYGIQKQEAEKQIDEWIGKLGSSGRSDSSPS